MPSSPRNAFSHWLISPCTEKKMPWHDVIQYLQLFRGGAIGSTPAFGAGYPGSSPGPGAILPPILQFLLQRARRLVTSVEILCFARLQLPANLPAADRCRPTRVAKGAFAVKSIAKKLAAGQARGTAARANSVGLVAVMRVLVVATHCHARLLLIHKPLAMDERLTFVRPLYAKNADNDC